MKPYTENQPDIPAFFFPLETNRKNHSYGQLALMLGNPRASRAVGYAMRACRTPGVPCHRVVRADGSTTPAFGPGVQRALLEAEGVPFTADGRVELGGCRWDGA